MSKSKATSRQIEYIKDLLSECGYDEDEYDLDNLTREEASDTINQLKFDLGIYE